MCNTYSPVRRVCVTHALYVLTTRMSVSHYNPIVFIPVSETVQVTVTREILEESDQFRFPNKVWLGNREESEGLILLKTSSNEGLHSFLTPRTISQFLDLPSDPWYFFLYFSLRSLPSYFHFPFERKEKNTCRVVPPTTMVEYICHNPLKKP